MVFNGSMRPLQGLGDSSNLLYCSKFNNYEIYSQIPNDENRCFKLEGYLFPDTYDFFLDEPPESVISRFLSNTDVKITDEMRQRATELGYTMDEIIIIASIIQAEGAFPDDAATIAGMAFANASSNNPGTNNITFYVKNAEVANLVKASMGTGSYVAIYVGSDLYAEIK